MSKSKNRRHQEGQSRPAATQRLSSSATQSATPSSPAKPPATASTAVVRRRAGKRDLRMTQRVAARRQRNGILAAAVAVVIVVTALAIVLSNHKAGTSAAAKPTANTAATAYANCPKVPAPVAQATPAETPPPTTGKTVDAAQGLKYIDITPGCGPAVKAGDNVTVDYTGWLASNGKRFDSSLLPGRTPFQVQNVGQASVIQGWNLGLIGMKPGGTRRLIIPASLGYGAQGAGTAIPPNATLIFDITLKSIDS
jgi:FKBP-type peptidyl-prolyl cis-trans isomerase